MTVAVGAREIPPERSTAFCDRCPVAPFFGNSVEEFIMGRGLLLWMLGIPIPVLILLYVFHVI
jgi:hypothetical protein